MIVEEDLELAAIRAKLRKELSAPAKPIDVTDASFESFVTSHNLVVVDCWAPWCGPCRIVGPIVDELARELSGKVVFGKLNSDENPAVMQAFGIQSIPTLLIFKAGRLADRIVGAVPKPRLSAMIQRHL